MEVFGKQHVLLLEGLKCVDWLVLMAFEKLWFLLLCVRNGKVFENVQQGLEKVQARRAYIR